MKKFLALLLCIPLVLLTGCTAKQSPDKKIIAVSFYPVYIFTLNIVDGIDELSVECMAEQNTGCLHDYTITAKDARLISDCSIFVINGAGMEGFIEDLYHREADERIVDSSIGVERICSHTHEEEHSGHSHDHEENSHMWLSVDNAIKQVENISGGIISAFPEYEEKIQKNTEDYLKTLSELKEEIENAKAQLQGKSVVTFHDAYAYLAEDLGFHILTTIESDEGGEPSAKELAHISEEIKEHGVKTLFIEPDYEGSAAEILKNETGAEIYVLNPVISGEKEKNAYEDTMRENIKIILKAVN